MPTSNQLDAESRRRIHSMLDQLSEQGASISGLVLGCTLSDGRLATMTFGERVPLIGACELLKFEVAGLQSAATPLVPDAMPVESVN